MRFFMNTSGKEEREKRTRKGGEWGISDAESIMEVREQPWNKN
jgi:hypothetical protein